MGKRLPYTPNSKIKNPLRRLWMTSRERAAALKREGYCCERCGAKQSRAKGREVYIEVHHRNGVTNWNAIYEAIRKHLLCDPDELEVLCDGCHHAEHSDDKKTHGE